MKEQIAGIQKQAESELAAIADLKDLEAWQVKFLGKKGELTLLLRETGKLPEAERPAFGASVNQAKAALLEKAEARQAEFEGKELQARISTEKIDVTLPGRPQVLGASHVLTQVMTEACAIFGRMGFNIETGPELEDAFHNFDALHVPEDHPSREPFDTFYVGGKLLRTHTSPTQIRVMKSRKPPIRMVAPGRVFRRDALDATHSPQFHQIEGLAVDAFGKVRLSDLKGTLEAFVKAMFGRDLKSRFRPSHFPFTEPSLEVDMQCFACKGSGCGLCKQSGWIELGGAGMVHPEVFKAVGYDPQATAGFAFGFGVDRVAMLKHGIPDIRLLYENDPRFLSQF